MVQIRKKFTDSQVKDLIERYLDKKIERKYVQEILGIKKRRFFTFAKDYIAQIKKREKVFVADAYSPRRGSTG